MSLLLRFIGLIVLLSCGLPAWAADQKEESRQAWLERGTVPQWLERLHSPDPKERERAAAALESLDPPVTVAGEALLRALEDSNPYVVGSAVLYLGRHRYKPRYAVPTLTFRLNDPGLDMTLFAVSGLMEYGKDARRAVPDLCIQFGQREDPRLRAVILMALRHIDSHDERVERVFKSALQDKSDYLRARAAWEEWLRVGQL